MSKSSEERADQAIRSPRPHRTIVNLPVDVTGFEDRADLWMASLADGEKNPVRAQWLWSVAKHLGDALRAAGWQTSGVSNEPPIWSVVEASASRFGEYMSRRQWVRHSDGLWYSDVADDDPNPEPRRWFELIMPSLVRAS
jgi:hypothetical protein